MKHSTSRWLLAIIFATILFGACKTQDLTTGVSNTKKTHTCKAPQFLQKGDKVALISPAYATEDENVDKTTNLLRQWGLEPVVGPNVGKIYLNKYAGTASQRKSDLLWALNDKSIKAVICNRGGYGSLQEVDKELMDAI